MPPPNSPLTRNYFRRIAPVEARPLTPRELEVIEWVAAGKRNGEIGQIIECSPRTVQKHVQNILAKLDLETRTAICVWWYERRLKGERLTRRRRKSARIRSFPVR
jgi:DNA-binding CsgD family transcriptional regulator